MALKTNFTDDILAESMNGKRQYNVTENSNGTKSLEDVTDYQSVGSTFSAKDMNETNAAVNQAYEDMGDEFNPEVDYAVGDYAIRNNKVWKFTTAHPAGAWDESHVKATKILSEARELTENLLGYPDYDKMSQLATNQKSSGTITEPGYLFPYGSGVDASTVIKINSKATFAIRHANSDLIPVYTGDTWEITAFTANSYLAFIPLRGSQS